MCACSINWLAVLSCVVVSMVSGFIWYNPKTFFPAWWKGIGKTENDIPGKEGMATTWVLTIVASFVQAVFLSIAVSVLAANDSAGANAVLGMTVGIALWAGVIAPTSLVNKLFAGHGLKVWAIESGNHLVNFVLFGAIIGAWN